jgi:MFS family permease
MIFGDRLTLGVILLSQFVAALSALGMPPFFSIFLKQSYGSDSVIWGIPMAGILFVVPTFFSGITCPFWGLFEDVFVKKRLLLRAQLGLGISFLIAGYSKTPFQFFLALLVQGILGGTFAASKAYIATLLKGDHLALGLTWLEAAPRAALVLAPFIVGYLLTSKSPVEIYRYLALLPFFSAAMTTFLPSELESKYPKNRTLVSNPNGHSNYPEIPNSYSINASLVTQLKFIFGMTAVMVSPYFNLDVAQRFSSLSPSQVGLIFGLPHLTYLFIAAPMTKVLGHKRIYESLIFGFILQAIAIYGQAIAPSLLSLVIYRTFSGISMTMIFIGLNLAVSNLVNPANSGKLFGHFESAIRLSNVAG